MDSEDPLIGSLIDDRYRVQSLLGTGGMGRVYRATQISMDRTVAIKVLNVELLTNERVVRRFSREMEAMCRVTHQNTIQVLDFNQLPDGRWYLVVEFLAGKTLSDIIAEGPLSVTRIIDIGVQIALALGAAHTAGIVHRDLKPDNIMLIPRYGAADFVKVLDFGIAHFEDRDESLLTAPGSVIGTPRYMSPEQAQGKPIDHRSDLYALGIVLYEMATGEPPFTGPTMISLLLQHTQQTPRPPSEVRPNDVPPQLESTILRLLSKEPEARHLTAMEVAKALDAVFPGTPILPNRNTVVSPLKPRAKRKIPLAIAGCVLALSVLIAMLIGWPRGDTPDRTVSARSDVSSLRHDGEDAQTEAMPEIRSEKPKATPPDAGESPKNDETSTAVQTTRKALNEAYAAKGLPATPARCQDNKPMQRLIGALMLLTRPPAPPDTDEAKKALSALKKLDKERPEIAVIAALAAIQARATDLESLAMTAHAVSLCPEAPVGWYARGTALTRSGRISEATLALEQAVGRGPLFGPARFNLGLLYLHSNRAKEAAEQFTVLMNQAPEYPKAKLLRGRSYLVTKQWQLAEKDFSQLIERGLRNGKIFYYRGQARLASGDQEGGQKDICTAAGYGHKEATARCP